MFKKFQSITNTKLKYLAHWQLTHGDQLVHVTEKIHGANYQVSYDGTGFTVGSRKKQLGATEGLYSDLSIRAVFCERVKLLYTIMKEQTLAQEQAALAGKDVLIKQGKLDDAEQFYKQTAPSISPTFKSIRVRGELYGGLYEHEDVCKLDIKRVGKGGISYAQNASVAVFRVEVDDVPLPWAQAKLLCFCVDLPTVPTVFNGTLDEAIEWSAAHVQDNTLIPNGTPWLQPDGTPLLLDGAVQPLPFIKGNGREGHVIEFQTPITMDDGRNVIFKDINPNHAETSKVKKKVPKVAQLNPEQTYVVANISAGFTDERIITQFSYDEYQRKDFMLVMGKVLQDCLGERRQVDGTVEDFFTNASAADRKVVTKELMRIACQEMRNKYMELTNG